MNSGSWSDPQRAGLRPSGLSGAVHTSTDPEKGLATPVTTPGTWREVFLRDPKQEVSLSTSAQSDQGHSDPVIPRVINLSPAETQTNTGTMGQKHFIIPPSGALCRL